MIHCSAKVDGQLIRVLLLVFGLQYGKWTCRREVMLQAASACAMVGCLTWPRMRRCRLLLQRPNRQMWQRGGETLSQQGAMERSKMKPAAEHSAVPRQRHCRKRAALPGSCLAASCSSARKHPSLEKAFAASPHHTVCSIDRYVSALGNNAGTRRRHWSIGSAIPRAAMTAGVSCAGINIVGRSRPVAWKDREKGAVRGQRIFSLSPSA